MDEYAGGVYGDVKCGQHSEDVHFFKEQICSLRLPFSRPVSNIYAQLISFANGYASEAQLARFWKIEPKWLCNIEWDALKLAVRRMRGLKGGNLCKLIHKQLPTMSMMYRNHRAEASPFPKNSSQKGRLWTPGRFEYYASSW